jgi:putative ABC transport system permease protein
MMKQAFLNIKSQKLLSAIMMTSIIAGVTSIYILFSIKNILAFQLKQQLIELGENNFLATFIPDTSHIGLHPIFQYEKIQKFIDDQSNQINQSDQVMTAILPFSILGSELSYGTQKYPGILLAMGNNFQALNIHFLYGRAFNQQDGSHKVVMLGKGLASAITKTPQKLVGTHIQFEDQLLKIVGIYELNASSLLDENLDHAGIISYPLALRLSHHIDIDHIYVTNAKPDKKTAINRLTDFYQHHIVLGEFHIKDADFILGRIKAQFVQIELILKWICFISLGVGSILFTQLFLLSLDKRQFEIGIRLACGAAPKDILIQFILESCVYYLMGGIIGIILGVFLMLGWQVLHQTIWPMMALVNAVIPVMLVTMILGVVLGLLPGIRSLTLHPMVFFKPGL